jgi:hypothetical protein
VLERVLAGDYSRKLAGILALAPCRKRVCMQAPMACPWASFGFAQLSRAPGESISVDDKNRPLDCTAPLAGNGRAGDIAAQAFQLFACRSTCHAHAGLLERHQLQLRISKHPRADQFLGKLLRLRNEGVIVGRTVEAVEQAAQMLRN